MMGALRLERGVTLLELMIALTLGGVLIVGVLAIWRETQQSYLEGAEQADLQQSLRVAMEQMIRVIRQAGLNPTHQTYGGAMANDPAFVGFRESGTSCLRVYADINGDGDVADADENTKFRWDGIDGHAITQENGGGPDTGQAWVGASGGSQQLALNIVANLDGSPTFQYFTGPGAPAPDTPIPAGGACGMSDANRAMIGRVVITLTARGTVAGETFTKTLVSEVRPRNVP